MHTQALTFQSQMTPKLYTPSPSKISMVNRLIKAVELRYGYTYEKIKQRDRHQDVVIARHALIYLLFAKTTLTLSSIAKLVDLNCSTVSINIKRLKNKMEVRDKIALEIKQLSDSFI